MKRTSFLTICFFAFSIGFLNAQTNQGKLLVGISSGSDIFDIGYTTSKQKSDSNGSEDPSKSFSTNLHPNMGYFIVDNLAIGLDLSVGLTIYKTGSDDIKITSTNLSAGPFVRYYVPVSNVLPFAELRGSFGTHKSKFDYSDNTYLEDFEDNMGIMTFGGGIGLAAPLGERVMVDILAGYHSVRYKEREDNVDNERTINGTLGLEVGFVIILGSN